MSDFRTCASLKESRLILPRNGKKDLQVSALSCFSSHFPWLVGFDEIETGVNESKVVFRLIHSWEARNPNKGGLMIGLELLLIDEKVLTLLPLDPDFSSVIQGFIAPHRVARFERRLNTNSIYSLTNFFATGNKSMYRVSDHRFTICFADNSVLSEVVDDQVVIESQKFRFCFFDQFESSCNRRGDLYDIIERVTLINGHNLQELSQIEFPSDSQKGRITVYLQPKEGPIVSIYLWDTVTAEFRRKLSTIQNAPSVLLVTTVNPKNIGGRVSLSSMSSSRVFFDEEVALTAEYLTWLGTQNTVEAAMDATQVVKIETATIGEIQDFIRTQPPQNATYHCLATIDQIKVDKGWYYVGLTGCNTKVTKSASALVCHKCENENATGVIMFRIEYFVHDKETAATFIFLDEAGTQLIGRKPTELPDEYIEANGDDVDTTDVSSPACLSEVLGQTHMFEVKVSKYNFRASRQTFTIAKIIKAEVGEDREPEIVEAAEHLASTSGNGTTPATHAHAIGSSTANESVSGTKETTDNFGNDSKRARLNP